MVQLESTVGQSWSIEKSREFSSFEASKMKRNNIECKQQRILEVDYELIERVRESVERDLRETSKEKYSTVHYESIMKKPLVCWRYIVHCDFNTRKAIELIKKALIWRKENGLEELRNCDLVKEFWLFAPITFSGVSKDGKDILYIIGKNYRKPSRKLRDVVRKFLLTLFFDWDLRHEDDMDSGIVVFDVSNIGPRALDMDLLPWIATIRDYVPTRIDQIYVVGVNWLTRPIVNIVISWLPETFRRLIKCGTFEELILANIDLDNLPFEVGGTSEDSHRLAPIEASWSADSSYFSEPDIIKEMEDSFAFGIDEQRRQKLRNLQYEYERKLLNAQLS